MLTRRAPDSLDDTPNFLARDENVADVMVVFQQFRVRYTGPRGDRQFDVEVLGDMKQQLYRIALNEVKPQIRWVNPVGFPSPQDAVSQIPWENYFAEHPGPVSIPADDFYIA